MSLLNQWKVEDGKASLLSPKSGYQINKINPNPIASSINQPVYIPSTVNNVNNTNVENQPESEQTQVDSNNNNENNNINTSVSPVTIDTGPNSSEGLLSELERQNILGTGQLSGSILSQLGIDPHGYLGKAANSAVNKGIGMLTAGIPFNPLASIINPKVVEAPWGEKFTIGASGTLPGWVGQKNYDALSEIYSYAEPPVVNTPEATYVDDTVGKPEYEFYQDVDGQPVGIKPGLIPGTSVLQGTTPEGVNTPAELKEYVAKQEADKVAKEKFIAENNITSNSDGSYTWNDIGGVPGETYTTNVVDSTGKPSLPSESAIQQAQEKAAAKAAEEAAAAQAAEQAAAKAAAEQAAAKAAAEKAAAEKAAQLAAQQNNSSNNSDGWTDPGTNQGGAAHGGGYGGYADDAGAANSGGGGGGGSDDTWCCTAANAKGHMTKYQITKLRKWHTSQSNVWQKGYDIWGKIIADKLVSKYDYFADLTKSFYEWRVNKKFSFKAAQAWMIIVPMSMLIGSMRIGGIKHAVCQ